MSTNENSFLVKLSGQWWITTMYVIGAVTLVLAIINWNTWEMPRLIAALFVVGLSLHVFEELNYPAGFHYMLNSIQKSDDPEAGPENRLSDLITNLGVQLLMVGVVIVGGNIAITLAFVFFGIGETIIHLLFGTIIYRKLKPKGKKTIYGPGTITSLFAFLPVAIWGIVWLSGQTVTVWDVLIAIVIIGLTMGVGIRLPMILIDGRKHRELSYKSTGYFAKFLH